MGTKRDGSVVKNIDATFHLVVKVNKDTDIEHMLKKETEWIGEPESAAGVVVAMRLKELHEINNGK